MKKLSFLFLSVVLLASCAKNDVPAPSTTIPAQPIPTASGSADVKSFESVYDDVKSEYRKSDMMNSCMVNMVNTCLNQVVTDSAQKKNDETICEDLSEPMTIEFCKQGVILSKIEKGGDISLCDSLKQNKNNCIMQGTVSLAIKKKDVKICDTIKKPEQTGTGAQSPLLQTFTKENCIDQVAFNIATATQDAGFCDKISNENQKNMCHSAITPKKPVISKELPAPLEKKTSTKKK